MDNLRRHLDLPTRLTILVTLGLFIASLLVHGFSSTLLLEAGVFLVSVKLMLMAYKSQVAASELASRLDAMQSALERIERALAQDASRDR